MNFLTRKFLAEPAAIGTEHILDLVHHDALARRPALMHAQVLVGVELALPMEHADLAPAVGDNPALAVGKLGSFGNENVRHAARLRPMKD
jgi:hypothetical protein